MALLFLKKKLFGAQDAERRESISSKSGKARCSESSPLIAHDSSKCYNRPSDEESQIPSSQTSSSDTVYDSDTESERSSARSRIDARVVSDAIIGLSDGLTVPFALSAGLSAVGSTKIVILGGLAELVAGAISMGLGGYLGAISEAESYQATLLETEELVSTSPVKTASLVHEILSPFALSDSTIAETTTTLQQNPKTLVRFLMNFHHKESAPDASRAYTCALTLALGYFCGGFVPLVPYFCVGPEEVITALIWSASVMAVTLFLFGYVKTCVVRGSWFSRSDIFAGVGSGCQMCLVGLVAAGAAVLLVRGIEGVGGDSP